VIVIDGRTSTAKLVQDLALARRKLLSSSHQVNAAASNLNLEIRDRVTRKSTIVLAVLAGVLFERTVRQSGSRVGSLPKAMVLLREIVAVVLVRWPFSGSTSGVQEGTPAEPGA
jgi:hypothetical protein